MEIAKPMIRTSITLTPEFYNLCKEHHIKFSEALRVGISIILSEMGVKDYDNNLNIYKKMRAYQNKVEQLLKSIDNKNK